MRSRSCWISFDRSLLFFCSCQLWFPANIVMVPANNASHLQIGWVFHDLTAEHVWNLIRTSCIKSSSTLVEKKKDYLASIWMTVIGIQLLSYAINFFMTPKKWDLSKWHLHCVLFRDSASSNLSLHNEHWTAAQCDTLTVTTNIFLCLIQRILEQWDFENSSSKTSLIRTQCKSGF